jgi:gliding motility-associated transport system permease protein
MRTTLAVAKREFSSYFNSPIAYIAISSFLVCASYFFFEGLFMNGQAELRGFFELAPLLFAIFTPMFTMRLLAEERAQGTLELLLTYPVTDWQVVLGKYLAAIGLIAVLLALSLTLPFSVAMLGPLDKGVTTAGYLAMLLMSGTYAAIGLMCSSFTRSQVMAVILAFLLGFGLFVIGWSVPRLPPTLAAIANAVSIQTHFMNVARGVLDTRDLLYYLTIIASCLVIAQTSLESRRWR